MELRLFKYISQNSIHPFMIALAKLSVLANVPDDPAKVFITDCQSIVTLLLRLIFFVLCLTLISIPRNILKI